MQVLSVSLFWTGAVLCNTVHVIVSGMVFHVLFQCGQEESSSLPPSTLVESLRYAVTTSFGSICYGSLFTAAIRTLRWEVQSPDSFYYHLKTLLFLITLLYADKGSPVQDLWKRVSTLLC